MQTFHRLNDKGKPKARGGWRNRTSLRVQSCGRSNNTWRCTFLCLSVLTEFSMAILTDLRIHQIWILRIQTLQVLSFSGSWLFLPRLCQSGSLQIVLRTVFELRFYYSSVQSCLINLYRKQRPFSILFRAHHFLAWNHLKNIFAKMVKHPK